MRFFVFVIVFFSIVLGANAFVAVTWSSFLGSPSAWRFQLISAPFALAFVAATIIGFRHTGLPLRIVYGISATWLGALNYFFFAAGACWMVAGLFHLIGLPVPAREIGLDCFIVSLVATLVGLVNAMWLRVTPVTVRLRNLPVAWRGRSAVLVTDLHLGHLSGPWFLRRVLRRVAELKAAIVLISGDLFDGTTAKIDQLVAPWKDSTAQFRALYVTGNHDEFAERTIYLDAVRGVGIQVLNNEAIEIDGMQFIGVHDREAGDEATLAAILRAAAIDPARPSILLAHQPANLRVVEAAGVSLQLSGHTHQGQFWPWNLLVRRIYGCFAYGLHRLGKLQVLTSSGAGTWGPPLRMGTHSEIVHLRFEPEESGAPPRGDG
jgi:predicted MPP superfamily phosphohydrolase